MAWDVVVWGGGSGGVTAALQSARSGATTLLLTPGIWLGGMLSAAGVSAPDGHELSCWQSGLWGALLRTLDQRVPDGLDQNWVSCFGFRPDQAEAVLQDWVDHEPTLDWWNGSQLLDVVRSKDRIEALIDCHAGVTTKLTAEVFIDGSDLGDLMALAEVPFRFGWEAQEIWNEPSAPSQDRLSRDPFFEAQPIQSPTWVVLGQCGIGRAPEQPQRSPDAPFERCLDEFGLERVITYGHLPGGLVMLNWPIDGNDWHHGLDRCIAAEPERRANLDAEMQVHSRNFLNTLQTCSGGWLQPGKGFPGKNPDLALMPYWREGRRLKGLDVVTESDILPLHPQAKRGPLPIDEEGLCTSIAVGTYVNDHHYPGDDWPLAPKSCRWGGRWTGTPFCIPYKALICASTSNLLMADKAFSVSHMANGATRLQPLIMNIGQAAGLAAAMAVRDGSAVSDVSIRALQEALIQEPQAPAAVMPIWTWPTWHDHWRDAQLRACRDPDGLTDTGELSPQLSAGLTLPAPEQGPSAPRAVTVQGRLRTTAEGSWTLETQTGSFSLITLEPGVNASLCETSDGQIKTLQVCRNPWGPWLRVVRMIN